MIRSKKGSITVDFIISFTICCILVLYFFMVAFSLMYIEVSQYITYQSARALFIGQKDVNSHKNKSKEIYQYLQEKFKLHKGNSNRWFFVSDIQSASRQIGYQDGHLNISSPDPSLFYGVLTTFSSRVMGLGIPFLGDTLDTNNQTDGKFQVKVGSYLGRESSRAECMAFRQQINQSIVNKYRNQISNLNLTPATPATVRSERGNGC